MAACNTGCKRMRKPKETKMPIRMCKSDDDDPYLNYALLLDGVTASRRLEQYMLESLGIYTVTMDSSLEAMQHLMTGAHFDFIFVDFDFSVVQGPEIRLMGIQSKFVGMSTNLNVDTVQMFSDAGAIVTLEKPLDAEVLGEVIGILRML